MNFDLDKINATIEEQGRYKKWVAAQVGVSHAYLSGVLLNRRRPSLNLIERLANVLKLNPKDLLLEELDRVD